MQRFKYFSTMKKTPLAMACAVLSLSSQAQAACDPTISAMTVGSGLVHGIAKGSVSVDVPACFWTENPSATLYLRADRAGQGVLTPVSITGSGGTFAFKVDGISAAGSVDVDAKVLMGDPASGTQMALQTVASSFATATMPTVTPESATDSTGGLLAHFEPGTPNNCPLTTDYGKSLSRDDNWCYVSVTAPGVTAISSGGDLFIGDIGSTGTATIEYDIIKFAQNGQPQVLASSQFDVTVNAVTPSLLFSLPNSVSTTQPVYAVMGDANKKFSLTEAGALALAQAAQAADEDQVKSYWVDFSSLPFGITPSEVDGTIVLQGKALWTGTAEISFLPSLVQADTTVVGMDLVTQTLAATMPTISTNLKGNVPATQNNVFSFTPTANLCGSTLYSPGQTLPAEGGCVLRWQDDLPAAVVRDGTQIKGAGAGGLMLASGNFPLTWTLSYETVDDSLSLDSGTLTVQAEADTGFTGLLTAPKLTAALNTLNYVLTAPEPCSSVAADEASAITAAAASNQPVCFFETSLHADFLVGEKTITGNQLKISGIFKNNGSKGFSAIPKMVAPGGTITTANSVSASTLVAVDPYSFKFSNPTQSRQGRAATMAVSSGLVPCTFFVGAGAANTVTTSAGDRRCKLVYSNVPDGWTADSDGLSGTMPATTVTAQAQVIYPFTTLEGDVVDVVLADITSTMASYNPVPMTARLTGRTLADGSIFTDSKGYLGTLVIDTATPGLPIVATLSDESGVLSTLQLKGQGASSKWSVASLGTKDVFAIQNLDLSLAYGGDDGDVKVDQAIEVLRLPDVTPTLQVSAPTLAKSGVDTVTFDIKLGEVANKINTYDAARVGEWKVWIAQVNADKSLTALTTPTLVTQANGAVQQTLAAATTWLGKPLVAVAQLQTEVAEAARTLQTVKSFTVNALLWPNFDVVVKMPKAFAPTSARLEITSDDPAFWRQAGTAATKASYDWIFPAGMTARASGATATLVLPEQGEFEIEIQVYDTMGQTATITKTVTVAPPAAYVLDSKLTSTNRWPTRAPAQFALRQQISGGHPKDRPASYSMSVNGTVVYTGEKFPRLVDVPNAGDNTLVIDMLSNMGATATMTKTIALVPNVPPTCTLTNTVKRGNGYTKAACTDSDGRVKSLSWEIDGQVVPNFGGTGKAYAVGPSGTHIKVTATDDAGGTGFAEAQVTGE